MGSTRPVTPSPQTPVSSRWANLPIRYKGAVVIAIPCGCLLLSLVFFALLNREQQAAASLTLHTQRVRLEASRLMAALVDAETGQRGYLLTGQEAFLEPYQQGLAVVPESLGRLRRLVSDNPAQLKRLDAIENLAKERLERMQANLKPGGSAEMAVRMTRSKEVMDELRRRTAEFEGEENRLEDLRRNRMQQQQTWFQWGLALATIVAFSGGMLAVFLFSSGISQRLSTLETSAAEMAEGKTGSWPLTGGDEISHLARRLQGVAEAIAQREQAQEELKRFFSISMDLLCIAGTDGYFKAVNPRWEKVLGYSQQELLSRPYLDFIHPEDREATYREVARQAEGHDVMSFENRYRCRDGSYRWFNWTATAVTEGGVIYAAARDVTERKREQQELMALNQELEAFTYSVSHDLRAPLRHISGFSRILGEEYGPSLDPAAQRYLERIQAGTRQMGMLVDDLLNLGRIGRQELRLQATGLNSLLEDVLEQLKPEADGRQVEWRIGRLPFVDCDPGLMKQVLLNLASNALKYTRPRERAVIEVSAKEKDGAPVIVFRDNGVGFSMKYADKLFGVFQRLHRPEDFEGTGIGLATVQRILHKHGGRAWAEAELDKGATFYFTLEPAEGKSSQDKIPTGGAVTHDGTGG